MLTAEQLEAYDTTAGRVIVAFSGGLDSHVLLHYLVSQLNRTVEALHINHGLDAHADDWQAHCEKVCDALQVPLSSFSVAVERSGSLETNAREARYLVFKTYLEAGDRLLLAHHQDDQVETLLLNLTSGRAPLGLLGMPAKRALGQGVIERPMLQVRKQLIVDYAKAQDLSWIEDPSNTDTRHTRNLIRHNVLPTLQTHWPEISVRMIAAWENTEALMAALEAQGAEDMGRIRLGAGMLELDTFSNWQEPRQIACMRQFLTELGYEKTLGDKTLKELCFTLISGNSGFDLGSWFLQSVNNRIYASKSASPQEGWLTPDAEGLTFSGGEMLTDTVKGLGFKIPANQLRCHVRQGGESVLVRGHHRTLKNLFQEIGVPSHIRDHVPLIWLGDQCVGVCGIPSWQIPMIVSDDFAASSDEFGCELGWVPPGLTL